MAKKPKRPKYPKLPNGFGSIRKLSGNRTNPFGVYPPVTEYVPKDEKKDVPVHPKAIAYVDTWLKGMAVLSAYHAGTYSTGQELPDYIESHQAEDVLQGIVSDFNASKRARASEPPMMSFEAVYEAYFAWKYEDENKKLSEASRTSTRAAFKNFAPLHNRDFCKLTHDDFQSTIDDCNLGFSSKSNMVILAHGVSEYAIIYKICPTNESSYLKVKIENNKEEGEPFSDDELEVLWSHRDNPMIEMLLIMCYSGYRIKAYESLYVNLDDKYFRGGVKNKFSKNRIVPIHSAIAPLVNTRIERDGIIYNMPYHAFRKNMAQALELLEIKKRTPHDCRHTFSRLCEKYGVNENDRKRLLGHSFGGDITNSTYGHRSIEDLRAEIEKIKVCLKRV